MPAIKASNQSSIVFQGVEIKGLLPAVDARTVEKPFVIDGRNFLFDVKGPLSSFCSRIPFYNNLFNAKHVYTFVINNISYICTHGAILFFDTVSQRLIPAYTFVDNGSTWPWSIATCGGLYFFCRQGVGVIAFDQVNNIWTLLTQAVPNDPRYVTQTFGRLVIVGKTQTVWSALDDGTNLTPSQTTGAGFQGHSIISGVANGMVCKQINDGVLIYTDNGCYIGQISLLGTSPFRWFTLDRARVPLNPHCFADIDSTTHVLLERKGLYQTHDGNFTEFDPLFSEYIRNSLFPFHDLSGSILDSFRLSYDQNNKYFCIHEADDSNTPLYKVSYTKYIPKDEWGRMDRLHYALASITFSGGTQHGTQTGYVDEFGYFHKLITDPFVEQAPNTDFIFEYHPSIEIPIRQQNIQVGQQAYFCSSEMKITTYSEAVFANNNNNVPGQYFLNKTEYFSPSLSTAPVTEITDLMNVVIDDWQLDATETDDWGTGIPDSVNEDYQVGGGNLGVLCGSTLSFTSGAILYSITPYIASSIPLNSYIRVGLMRFEEAVYNDEVGCVTNIVLGVDAIPGAPTMDDYQLDNSNGMDIFEDWQTLNGAEDYGTNLTLTTSFNLLINGYTDDGQTLFQSEVPQLEVLDSGSEVVGGAQYYVCETNGCFHDVTINALAVGQSFHLKLLELSGFLAGRL